MAPTRAWARRPRTRPFPRKSPKRAAPSTAKRRRNCPKLLKSFSPRAKRKFGLAASGDSLGKISTADKQKLEDALDSAIRRIQTGARLTFPNSLEAQRRYGVGIALEDAEDQVELLVPQILQQLQTETLRSVKPAQITALQSAFTAWMNAGGAQNSTKLGTQTDRAGGYALLKEIEPMVREIKISIDGEFPYDAPVTPDQDIKTIRKRFHIPQLKPYVYVPRSE